MRLLRQHRQVGVPARVVAVNRHARAAFRFQVRQLLAVAVHFAQARGDDRALKPDYPAQDTEQSVKREFVRLETSISAELQSSSQSISNAIREQNGRLTSMIRTSVSAAMAWVFLCFALLIGIMGGIIWFQGTIITSRLSEMDSYSQQLASLKAKSGAGVTIYSDDTRRNTYLVVLPKQAHGVETYTSTTDNTVVKYTAK